VSSTQNGNDSDHHSILNSPTLIPWPRTGNYAQQSGTYAVNNANYTKKIVTRPQKPYRLHIATMTKAQQTISLGLLVSSLYLALYFHLIPLPQLLQSEIIPVFPFWVLVSFGSYLLFKLGYGVFTFNDVPDAHKELMSEIELARADLRTKGVDVD